MKKYIFYISVLSLILCVGCSEEEIVTSKPGVSIDPVTNLSANITGETGEEVLLTWDLPTSYPEEVVQPVSVKIDVRIDGKREGGAIVLGDNPETHTYSSYDSSKEYRFTVKVMAEINTSEPYVSDLSYSPGKTIEL